MYHFFLLLQPLVIYILCFINPTTTLLLLEHSLLLLHVIVGEARHHDHAGQETAQDGSKNCDFEKKEGEIYMNTT